MITDVYAHILDEDRKVNAQKFEASFYAKNSVNLLKDVKAPEDTNSDLTNLISTLEQSPELVAMLAKALKQNAISKLLATALKVQFCVRFPLSSMADNKYPKNRVLRLQVFSGDKKKH